MRCLLHQHTCIWRTAPFESPSHPNPISTLSISFKMHSKRMTRNWKEKKIITPCRRHPFLFNTTLNNTAYLSLYNCKPCALPFLESGWYLYVYEKRVNSPHPSHICNAITVRLFFCFVCAWLHSLHRTHYAVLRPSGYRFIPPTECWMLQHNVSST